METNCKRGKIKEKGMKWRGDEAIKCKHVETERERRTEILFSSFFVPSGAHKSEG
jgi:hypothetical protein